MVTEMTQSAVGKTVSARVSPMPLWQALLYFGLPALLFRLSLYGGIPLLMGLSFGLHGFQANVVAFTVPSAILFALAFGFYKREGHALRWDELSLRFRLFRMSGRDWLWALGGLVVTFLSIGALGFTASLLIHAVPALTPPDFFAPWLQPGSNLDLGLYEYYIGAPLHGNWGVAALVLIMFFFNIFGEELWWRGYILPRQELVHGRLTWLVNGLLWLFWHAVFYPWQIVALLPICLILPYIAQRRQNTWVAIIIHLQNAILGVIILLLVLGLIV